MANPASDTTPGDVTPPSAPSTPVVTQYLRGLQVQVPAYTRPADFSYFKYFKKTGAGSLTFWRASDGEAEIDYNTVSGTVYQYAVSAVDTSGNESSQSGSGSGTPALATKTDIGHHEVTTGWQDDDTADQAHDGSPSVGVETSVINNVSVLVAQEDLLAIWSGEFEIQNNNAATQAIFISVRMFREGTQLRILTFGFALGPGTSVFLPASVSHVSLDLAVADYDFTVSIQVAATVNGDDADVIVRNRCLQVINLRV